MSGLRNLVVVLPALLPLLASRGQEKNAEVWWSLRPIVKPALPAVPATFQAWPRNAVDHFVLAKLRDKGLAPAGEADRRTLLRRVYVDLTGLLPSIEEIETFAKDTAADAYEKAVDRLLASPRYGERWARHWMDVCHFAETHGHDQDVPRDHAWPYRDYLIESFNSDKPFGRFIDEQIAGDVLYPDDPRAIVGLGFLAAGPWDESSLKDIREDTLDRKAGQYLDRDDMIGTVSYSFLSATVQCARCHDHKFDPIGQDEYYALQAVFAGVDRADRPFDTDPKVRARRRQLVGQLAELAKGGSAAAKLVQDPVNAGLAATWEKAQATRKDLWSVLDPIVFTAKEGSLAKKLPDLSLLYTGTKPDKDTYVIETPVGLAKVAAVRLEVLTDESLPLKGPGRQGNGNLHLSEFTLELQEGKDKKPLAIARAFADFNQQDWDIGKAIDGNLGTAWGVYPAVGQPHAGVFVLREPIVGKEALRLVFTLAQQHGGGHLIGRPRLSAIGDVPVSTLAPLPPGVAKVLTKNPAQRSELEKNELAAHALKSKFEEELGALPATKMVYAAAAEFQAIGSFRSSKGCKPVHMLRRGDIKRPGQAAVPGALACVTALPATFKLADPADEGQRRAALAHWISSPKNPLTWRSIANRVWHYHFGRGIVATPSDFGRMGATPTHPELLDWLAAYLLENGGSLKKLHRLIVTSATYRQAATHNADFAKVDADNAYLWHWTRTRLDAESLRDNVLQVAGKLDLAMGGPSIKFFKQTPGHHRTPNVDYLQFDPDGPGGHRRSVYRFVFRTVPDPFQEALDCPDASQFTAVRSSSLTALQALALLNDPFMVRMSEHFAKRLAMAGTTEKQIQLAYRLALGREATAREQSLLVDFAGRNGMANACRVLFNCNEFLFVE